MNTRKKKITSVEVSNWCPQLYPCQHFITIKYTNGAEKKQYAFGDDIANEYFNYLNQSQKMHFSKYIAKSGIFGNQSNSTQKHSSDNSQKNTEANRLQWRLG